MAEKKPKLMATLELGEGVRIEIPKDVLKKMVEENPNAEAAVEACMTGTWAKSWSEAVTGITPEEEAREPTLKTVKDRAKRLLCTRLVEAIKVPA